MNPAVILGAGEVFAVSVAALAAWRLSGHQTRKKAASRRENLRIPTVDDLPVRIAGEGFDFENIFVENASCGGLALRWSGMKFKENLPLKVTFSDTNLDAIVVGHEKGILRLRYAQNASKAETERLRLACLHGTKRALEGVAA